MRKKGKDIRSLVQDGDSVAVTIPPEFLESNNLQLSNKVELVYDDVLLIKPISEKEIERELEENKDQDREEDSDGGNKPS